MADWNNRLHAVNNAVSNLQRVKPDSALPVKQFYSAILGALHELNWLTESDEIGDLIDTLEDSAPVFLRKVSKSYTFYPDPHDDDDADVNLLADFAGGKKSRKSKVKAPRSKKSKTSTRSTKSRKSRRIRK